MTKSIGIIQSVSSGLGYNSGWSAYSSMATKFNDIPLVSAYPYDKILDEDTEKTFGCRYKIYQILNKNQKIRKTFYYYEIYDFIDEISKNIEI